MPSPPAGLKQSNGWGGLDARMRARLIGRRFMQDLERVPRWWEGFDPQVVGPSLADGTARPAPRLCGHRDERGQ